MDFDADSEGLLLGLHVQKTVDCSIIRLAATLLLTMHQSCGDLLTIDEDYDVEEDDRDHKYPRVTPREKDSDAHPAGTMQVCRSALNEININAYIV